MAVETPESIGNSVLLNWLKLSMLICVPIVFSFFLFLPQIYTPPSTHEMTYGFQLAWVYAALVVGTYWMLNIVPVAVVGFIPLVILPLLGIGNSKKLANSFMSNLNMTNLGSMLVVLAIDASGLRCRITLRILKHSSGSLLWIFVYIFFTTMLVAMWMKASAAAFLMMRVVDETLEYLRDGISMGTLGDEKMAEMKAMEDIKANEGDLKTIDEKLETVNETSPAEPPSQDPLNEPPENEEITEEDTEVDDETGTVKSASKEEGTSKKGEPKNDESKQFLQAYGGELLYAIAVASNIGGTLWPWNSPMGIELFKLKYSVPYQFNTTKPISPYRWTEATWMTYYFPLVLINASLALSYLLWVSFFSPAKVRSFFKLDAQRLVNIKQSPDTLITIGEMFSDKHKETCTAFSFKEKGASVLLVLLVLLCIFRFPVYVTGWADLISYSVKLNDDRIDVGDSVSYTIIVLLLFITPQIGHNIIKGPTIPTDKPKHDGLVGWKSVQNQFPWGVMVLIGGSSCIGDYVKDTVAKPISTAVSNLKLGSISTQLVMIGFTALFTHIMSNPGASIAIMHIWSKLKPKTTFRTEAELILPVMSVASLCFIIPASSIPTALVYRYKNEKKLSAWYFLMVGVPLFLITLLSTTLYMLIWNYKSLQVFW